MSAIRALTCDNKTDRRGAGNASTVLTHLSDYGGRGLGVSLPIEEFNAARLLARSERDPETGCLRWTGPHDLYGYGCITVNGRTRGVHRLAHEVWIGPIPDGHEVDHVVARGCRHRDCFEPRHLEAVTHHENVLRVIRHKTHCRQGHPWIPENIRTRQNGERGCRLCDHALHRRRRPCPVCGRLFRIDGVAKHVRARHPEDVHVLAGGAR